VDPKKGTYCQTSKKKKKQQKSTSSEPAADSKMNFQEPFTASQDIRQQNSKGSRCLKGIFGIFPVFFFLLVFDEFLLGPSDTRMPNIGFRI